VRPAAVVNSQSTGMRRMRKSTVAARRIGHGPRSAPFTTRARIAPRRSHAATRPEYMVAEGRFDEKYSLPPASIHARRKTRLDSARPASAARPRPVTPRVYRPARAVSERARGSRVAGDVGTRGRLNTKGRIRMNAAFSVEK